MSKMLRDTIFNEMLPEIRQHVIRMAVGSIIYFSKSTSQDPESSIRDVSNLRTVNRYVKSLVDRVLSNDVTIVLEDEWAARSLLKRPDCVFTKLPKTIRIDMDLFDTVRVVGLGPPHYHFLITGSWDRRTVHPAEVLADWEHATGETLDIAGPLDQRGPFCELGSCSSHPCRHQTLYHGNNVYVPFFRFVSMKVLQIATPRNVWTRVTARLKEEQDLTARRAVFPKIPPKLTKVQFLDREWPGEPFQSGKEVERSELPLSDTSTANWDTTYPFDPIPVPMPDATEIARSASTHRRWVNHPRIS